MAVLTKIVRQITGDLSDNSGDGLTGGSWVRSADATDILPSQLTNGNKYLIIAHGLWWSGADNYKAGMRFVTIDSNRDVVNANAFDDSWRDQEFSFSAAFSYSWMTVWTCDGNGIGIQLLPDHVNAQGGGPAAANHSVTLRHHTLTAIDITSLTENTDYYYSTASGLQATESTNVGTAYDTIVHTPPDNTNWLFLGYTRCRADTTAARPEVRWGEFGGTVMTEMRYGNEGENLGDIFGLGNYDYHAAVCAQVLSYGASPGSQTEHASYQRRESIPTNDSGLTGMVNSSMFLLNLDLFTYYNEVNTNSGTSAVYYTASDADPYPSANQPIETLDLTPANPNVNSLIIGQWCMDTDRTGNYFYAKWQDKANADYRSPAGAESPPLGDFPRITSGHDGGTSGNWFSTVPDPSTLTGDIGWRQLGGSGGSGNGAGFQHTMMLVLALDTASGVVPITFTAASTTDASTSTVKRVTDISMTAASTTDASSSVVTSLFDITHTAASTTDASTVTVDAVQTLPITLTAASTTDASTVDVDSIRNLTFTAASTTDAPAPVVKRVAQVSLTAASTTDASTTTVDTGGEVTPVGWLGTAVGERTFRQQNAWDPIGAEWSGITYNETRGHLIAIEDGGAYSRLNPTTGAVVGSESQISITWTPNATNNALDCEGVVWLGPNYTGAGGSGPDWYALLHEGGGGTNYANIGIVQILEGNTSVIDDAAMSSDNPLSSIPFVNRAPTGGMGAEGLTYDRNNDIFWVGNQSQSTTDTGHGLWKVDPNNSWSQTKVFDWADKINVANVTDGVSDDAIIGDIHHCALFDGDSIIVSIRGSEPTDNRAEFPNRRWFQLDLTTGNVGNIVSVFDYSSFIQDADGASATNFVGSGRTPQVEGFCMSDDGETVFMCRENNTDAGNGIFRIESETIGTNYTLITKGEDGWYYWDRNTNHFDASPAWNATNFDIDANANFMGPNQAGFGHVRDPLNVEGTATTSPPSGPIINTDTSGHDSEENATVNALTYYFVKEVWVPAGNIKECLIKAFVDDAAIIYCDGTEVFRTHLYAGQTAGHGISTDGNAATGTTQEGRQETNDGLIVTGGDAGIARPDTRTTIGSNFTTGAWNRIAALSGSNQVSSSDQFFDLQIELTYYQPITMTAASSTDASTVTVDATSVNLLPITFTAASTTDAATVDVDILRGISFTAASTTDASAAVLTRVEEIAHTAASTTDASTVDVDSLRQIAFTAASTTDAGDAVVSTPIEITLTAASTTDASTVLLTRTFAVAFTAESTTDSDAARVTRTFDISLTSASTTDASSALLTRLFEIAHTAASTTDAPAADVDTTKPISFTAASTTDAAAARLTRTFSVAFTAASTTDAGAALLSIGRAIQFLAESDTDAAAAVVDRLATIVHTAASTTDASTVNVTTSKAIVLTAASTTDAGAAVVQRLTEILHTAASTTDAPDAVLTRIFDIAHTAESTTDSDPAVVSTGLNISLTAATTTDAAETVVTTGFDISLTAASTTDTATVDVDLAKNITMTAASTTDANTIPITFGIDFTAASTTDSSSADVDSIRPIAFTAASTTDADSIGIVRGYEMTAASSTDAGTATVVSLIGISHVAASTTDAATVGVTSLESITFTAASTTDAAAVGLTIGQTIDIMFTAASTTDAPSATIVRVFDVALTGASTTDASSVPIIEGKQVLDDVSSGIDDNVGLVDVDATVLETPVVVDQPGTSSRTGSVLDTLTIVDTPIKTDIDIIEIEDMAGRTPRGWFQTDQGGEQWTVFEHRTSLTDPLVGKTIFRKAVDFGALPNTTLKSVAHGITDIDVNGWVRINGIVRGGNESEELSGAQNVTRVLVDSGTVKITTDADLSGKTAVVLLEYTKS